MLREMQSVVQQQSASHDYLFLMFIAPLVASIIIFSQGMKGKSMLQSSIAVVCFVASLVGMQTTYNLH